MSSRQLAFPHNPLVEVARHCVRKPSHPGQSGTVLVEPLNSLVLDRREDNSRPAVPLLTEACMHACMRAQLARRVGIDEVVRHAEGGDVTANKDPELRIWDALETGTHDDTMRDAMAEHLQARDSAGLHWPCMSFRGSRGPLERSLQGMPQHQRTLAPCTASSGDWQQGGGSPVKVGACRLAQFACTGAQAWY